MKRNKVELVVNTDYCSYNQINQPMDIRFSVANRIGPNKFKELTYRFKCREIMGDIITGGLLDINIPNSAGLNLTSTQRAPKDETIITIVTTKENYDNFMSNEKIIRSLEKMMGIPLKDRTKFYPVGEDTRVWVDAFNESKTYRAVVVGSKEWSSSPLMISFYSAILRCLGYNNNSTKTFGTFIKSYKAYTCGDSVTFSHFNGGQGFDYKLFFKNYKEILGDNPISGLNDSTLKEKIAEQAPHRADIEYDLPNSIGGHAVRNAPWSISIQHCYHGTRNFINKIEALTKIIRSEDLSDNIFNNLYRQVGFSWAYNYYKLSKAREE